MNREGDSQGISRHIPRLVWIRSWPDNSDRGVSFTVSYVVTLAITAVLIAGLLLTAGHVVKDQRETSVRDEANVVGDKVTASVMAADRLVRTGNTSNVEVTVGVTLPAQFADKPYVIKLSGGNDSAVIVQTKTPSVKVRVPLKTDTPIESTTVTGGPVHVIYLPDGGNGTGALTIEEAEE